MSAYEPGVGVHPNIVMSGRKVTRIISVIAIDPQQQLSGIYRGLRIFLRGFGPGAQIGKCARQQRQRNDRDNYQSEIIFNERDIAE